MITACNARTFPDMPRSPTALKTNVTALAKTPRTRSAADANQAFYLTHGNALDALPLQMVAAGDADAYMPNPRARRSHATSMARAHIACPLPGKYSIRRGVY